VDLTFTAEQDDLRAAVRRLVSRAPDGPGRDTPLWIAAVHELGLTALAIGEEHGGAGGSLVEVAIALEECGAALVSAPLLATAVAAAAVDPAVPAGAALRAGAAAGTTVAAFVDPGGSPCVAVRTGDGHRLDGTAAGVLHGDAVDVAVVTATCAGEEALFAVAVVDGVRTVRPTLDLTRAQADLAFDGAPARRVSAGGDGGAAARRALDLLRVALAVESGGVAGAALGAAIAHLRTRQQFGVPLATFQALRHRVADLWVRVEAARSSAYHAVRVVDTAEFAVAAPVAKLVATEAAYAVTAECIQLFGGIGFTWEHDAHRYFKRATANRLLAGDPVTLRRLIGRRAGLTA
jgi:alkylation response protein AidB-like acyl-CoA dehydrogenase